MTFEEWQKGRAFWEDLSQHPFCEVTEAKPGLIYEGGTYIELVVNPPEGCWMLTLGNEGWLTNDLLDLEHKLFDWCKGEGYEFE